MPLKLSLGLTEKHGLPDYGSIAASCHVEIELEATLLQNDLDGFHRQVQRAYAACRQAIQDELAGHQAGALANQVGGAGKEVEALKSASATNGHAYVGGAAIQGQKNGNGQNNGNGVPRASQRQFDYINQLSRQIKGLGVRRLETLAQKMFGKPIVECTSLDASGLIDMLKAIKAGDIDVDAVLGGGVR
ncbi:MAG: hypothetical protein GX621_05655 [Pirellulaceae bacterium]|nr:hypothetical protein [Pirellulaceae bacterium]